MKRFLGYILRACNDMTELTKRNIKILFLRTKIVEMDSPNNHNDWVKYEIIVLCHIDLYINYKHEYVPDN